MCKNWITILEEHLIMLENKITAIHTPEEEKMKLYREHVEVEERLRYEAGKVNPYSPNYDSSKRTEGFAHSYTICEAFGVKGWVKDTIPEKEFYRRPRVFDYMSPGDCFSLPD